MKTVFNTDIVSPWNPNGTEMPVIGISDELEALEFLGDADMTIMERAEAVWRDRPSLTEIRARAQFHTAELAKLLDCARKGQVRVSDELRDTGRALALLINHANVATVLIAYRTDEDCRALADLRRALRSQARRSRNETVRNKVSRLCGGDFIAMSEIGMRPAKLPQALPRGTDARVGQAAACSLDLSASLALWLATGTHPGDLLDGARELLGKVDTWRRAQQMSREPGRWVERIRGAELLAYARLTRLSLWPARDEEETAIKRAALALIGPRYRDETHMRAAVEWAIGLGLSLPQGD